jgi:riboflavin-specific deaminase-like protein
VAEIVLHRIFPAPGEVAPDALVQEIEPPGGAATTRPYTLVNFVASADGRATVEGRSGGLGDAGDHALFHALRERVDAVLAGTGTLRTERYGRILRRPERRERRIAAGRPAEPLAVVVSRTAEVPLDIPLFAEPEARAVVFSPVPPDPELLHAAVHWEPLHPQVQRPLRVVMETLRERHGVETLLCEGGPTVFAALLAEQLVDELFLTVAPKLVGGGGALTITHGPPLPELADLRLVWALERDSSLYLRYALG